jgi:alpha-L-fucosidase
MKIYLFALFLFFFTNELIAQGGISLDYMKTYNDVMNRTKWWRNDRLGMFIHFGAYAVAARGEWVKSNEKLTTDQYQKYIEEFNPVDFDAKKWAKTAKEAGMRYAVFTAKHHDGYCLFDSKLTEYKISNYFYKRDIVREFLDAFREEGLKVGLYYSIIDWHHRDFPNVHNHPQREEQEYSEKEYDWDNYLKYMHGQVEELTKNYGKLDIMWFDYSFDDYSGAKWKAKKLLEMVRNNQPDIIINNRLFVKNKKSQGYTITEFGDFETPEKFIPQVPLNDIYGNSIPWETCLTINDSWGYNETDKNWKSSEFIIQCLINCVSKNGNMLLNIGPDARGNFPQECISILSEVGEWLRFNGESIYGCGLCELPRQDWGRYTKKNNKLYVHWLYPFLGDIQVKDIDNNKVESVSLLKSGAELTTYKTWFGNRDPNNLFIKANEMAQQTDKLNIVVKIEMNE